MGREPSGAKPVLQHPPQIDDDLGIDILPVRRGEHFRLRPERDLELAVVLVRHYANRL